MMTNKDKRQDDNIEKMMESATEKTNDSAIKPSEKKNSSLKVVIFSVIGLIVFLGLLGFGAFMMNNNDDFEDKTNVPDWVGKEKDEEEFPISLPWDNKHPIEIPNWAKKPFDENDFFEDEDNINDVLKDAKSYENFHLGISWMKTSKVIDVDEEFEYMYNEPSTNDIEERYIDGEENPQFSYTLKEDYEEAFVMYTQRLLNPIFGGWSDFQKYDDENDFSLIVNDFEDMFSNDWWEDNIENSEDYSQLPIFIENSKGEWDDYNLSERNTNDNQYAFFYGEIVETEKNKITSEHLGFDGEKQSIIEFAAPVTFFAFDVEGETVKVNANLTLTLKSNEDNLDINNRVIIDSAKLSVND